MKKFAALLLAFILVIGLTACGSGAGAGNGTGSGDASTGGISKSSQEFIDALNAENAEEKGVCGADLTWYYKDNVLVIKGTGPMNDYDGFTWNFNSIHTPWEDKELNNKIHWILIDEGVTHIGGDAFGNFEMLSKVELPNTIETIGERAFSGCVALSSITIPSSVTEIGDSAFSDCDSLSSITIPDSVTTIGNSAFSNCESMPSITIPSSVTKFGPYVFVGCGNLTSVTFEGDVPEIEEGYEYLFDGVKLEQLTVTYSGSGFEPLIEAYPEINWVKK